MSNPSSKSSLKEKVFIFTSHYGVKLLQKAFPEYFAKQPLRPTDRYVEYYFAINNLPRLPARVLDVGCSGSFFPLLLAGMGYSSYGIDVREYAILNKLKFDNFIFTKGDMKKTNFTDNFFDCITAISTVEHIGVSGRYGVEEDAGGDKIAMKEMKRVLKPGGVILLTIPFGRGKIIRPYNRIYDSTLMNRLVEGFKIEKEEYFMEDQDDDWAACSKSAAGNNNSTKNSYALCLLKLTNIK